MKLLYLLLLLFVINQSVFAQKNFQSGYVVTLGGDTLRGTIDTREWRNNPKSVTFKNSSGKIETYTVSDAAGFGIGDQTSYSKYIMQISMDDITLANLSFKPKHITDTLFLRKLIAGKYLALYEYNDEIKTRYVIIDKKDGLPRELEYHILADTINSNEIIKTYGYRNQLTYYANVYVAGNSSVLKQINNSGYSFGLAQIVNAINGGDSKTTVSNKRAGGRFYAGASVNSSTLRYSGIINVANKPITFIGINAGLDVFENTAIGKTIFRLEAGFVPYHNTGVEEGVFSGNRTITQQQTITLSPQIIYNLYNKATFKAFINAGADANLSSYKHNLNNYLDMSTFWLNIHAGAGVTIADKFQIQFIYIPPAATIQYVDFSGSVSTIKVGINYLLPIKKF